MSMPSLVPAADRAPSLTSRIVTVHATDVTEGAPAPDAFVFSLTEALRVPADDVILRPGGVKVRLVDGRARVRLPVYTEKVQTIDGSTDWIILVTPSWGRGEPYPIRVPAGSGEISLADLPAVRPLTRREQAYAITGVGVTVKEGAQAGGTASYANGQLDLAITVPPFRPETVYPYVDATADARAEHYGQEIRADLDERLEEVTTAYELAVATGYEGTLDEWLDSLVGPPGDKGDASTVPGPPNILTIGDVTTGAAGSEASATITGTSPEQVLGLTIPRGDKGDKGDPSTVPGPTGKTAYQYAVDAGFDGTEEEFADAQLPDTITWENVDGKPDEYPPETHTHTQAQVDGLDDRLDAIESDATSQGDSLDAVIGRVGDLEIATEDTGWVDLPLDAAYERSSSPGAPPQISRSGRYVYIRGRVAPVSGNFEAGAGHTLGILPEELRPGYSFRTIVGGGSATEWGRLDVNANTGSIGFAAISGLMGWVDLGGIFWTID